MTTIFHLRTIRLYVILGLFFSTIAQGQVAQSQTPNTPTTDKQRLVIDTFVKTHCVSCHGATDPSGEFDLETFSAHAVRDADIADSSTWEKIVKRLRARQMPPINSERPSESQYKVVVAAFESVLDSAASISPRPGRTDSIRRLNRTEYHNAIRDLLAVTINVDDLLPADELSHGFDNVTVSELSPALLNRYITAAERISRVAVGSLPKTPGGITIRVPADRSQESHVEGLPFGTRGGAVFKYQFPTSGEYEVQIRLTRDRDENIEGLKGRHEIDVLIDRGRVHRFTVTQPQGKRGYNKDDTLVDANLKKRFRVTAGQHQVGVTFPRKFSSLSEIRRQPFDANFNRHRHPRRAPALFEVSIIGPFKTQDKSRTRDENAQQEEMKTNQLESSLIPSRRKLFTCRPGHASDARACAEKILRSIIRFAYRRPVTDADLVVPLRFFDRQFAAHGEATQGFDAGIESALAAVLVNPHFLFRTEKEPETKTDGGSYQVSDLELASRLSFFIWSSIPDETLLKLAEERRLKNPAILQTQVLRMLKDKKSESLVTNFAAQWLYLRNLESFTPDRRRFPDFDDNLRTAMRRETELLFDHVLRDDRSVLELIRTDTTFLNERLAKHYGEPGVFGSKFRAVKLTPNSHRGGLLRHSSILAVTSYATRTSPTIRGNWILENILGTPPPPPPPNIPALNDKTVLSNVSIRERLAEHRKNPACASCHNLMDPIGFSLENFDAVGRWRIFDQEQPVDATGGLPDGTAVRSLEDLEAGILKRPELFVGTLTEKLLTFALGRGVEFYDGPAVRQIVRSAADKDYKFSSLILGIATSPPFRMRAFND